MTNGCQDIMIMMEVAWAFVGSGHGNRRYELQALCSQIRPELIVLTRSQDMVWDLC
jgi:hypothetical protein